MGKKSRKSKKQEDDTEIDFDQMELDNRILEAVAQLGWTKPTPIQEKVIPLLLQGKDVLIRARTGSGKTGAFSIPVIQRILQRKQTSAVQEVKALIVAPSCELCQQISKDITSLTKYCSMEVRILDISPQINASAQKPLLLQHPDIVVGTPSKILAHLLDGNLQLKDLFDCLVIDEADLVFSFGYESDMRKILTLISGVYQSVLASATLSEDVTTLKKLVLKDPVTIKLQEPAIPPKSQLRHYYLFAQGDDKAAILYALLKLNLVRGKIIIFVSTVDRAYKVKLYLQQFGIRSATLNSELPASCRCHTVAQFNQGVYDIIIASDEASLINPAEKSSDTSMSKRKKDKTSGVSRGIDFQYVSNIINLDFPADVNSYIHRAGRTARGNNKGSVLSLVSVREKPLMMTVEEHLKSLSAEESVFMPFQFDLHEAESLRYRSQDAWRAVTRVAVREARLTEIRQEIYNSDVLKTYFEDNPQDLSRLRHDKALHSVKVKTHLANVPEYIIPESLKQFAGIAETTKGHQKAAIKRKTGQKSGRSSDPLTFDTDQKKKKRRKV